MKELTKVELPLLPLRDVVIYPHMVVPLFVGREKSIQALEAAMSSNKQVLLVAQRSAAEDDPLAEGIYDIGCVSSVLQLLKLPDGTVKVLVEGNYRAHVEEFLVGEQFHRAEVKPVNEVGVSEREKDVLVRSLLAQCEQYGQLSKKIPAEVLSSLSSIDDLSRLADTVAAHLPVKLEEKQAILEITTLRTRIEHLMALIEGEIDLLQVEKRIRGRVKKQMEKSQREYYLNEQMKAIQKELNDNEDAPSEFEEIEKRLESSGMSKEARKKAKTELSKLKMMAPMSAEATVVRSYLDWITNIPWSKRSKLRNDLAAAKKILDDDHYGLEEVKERILEYLAVQQRVKKLKGSVLCLVGPPGVGKTSLGESIARAVNRKFVRMALGGVRDEAEIRGHRRTYIGSLPGKVLQKMAKVGVTNPLFLLDEVDKMGMDMRGDPASALLEVLDPEQNHAFNDHYLEVDYDLSDVMFVCTSNSMNIPPALLDRMEVIRLSGYTEYEKIKIAEKYLLPKQIENTGLKDKELTISADAIRDIIRYYTREAGVRGLEREIAKICRKVVKEHGLAEASKKQAVKKVKVTSDELDHYLGVRKYHFGLAEKQDQVGQVTGLAWTQVGGELLTIEAAATPGKGKIVKTGSLGDVMQESIQAALTVVRSRANLLGIHKDFYEKNDLHIHVPEGATPKDGPSAGVGMCTAIVSVLTGIPVKAEVAMTGEITLRGQVLAIGGLKEKLLAAKRGGIKTVIIPEENLKDIQEIPNEIKDDLDIKPVKWIDEVLQIALQYMPEPLIESDDVPKAKDDSAEGRVSAH